MFQLRWTTSVLFVSILLCLLGLAMILLHASRKDESLPEMDEPPLASDAPWRSQPVRHLPRRDSSLRHSAIIRNNLFRPLNPEATMPWSERLELVGIVVSPRTSRAFILDKATRQQQSVTVGESVGPFQVAEISSEGVRLSEPPQTGEDWTLVMEHSFLSGGSPPRPERAEEIDENARAQEEWFAWLQDALQEEYELALESLNQESEAEDEASLASQGRQEEYWAQWQESIVQEVGSLDETEAASLQEWMTAQLPGVRPESAHPSEAWQPPVPLADASREMFDREGEPNLPPDNLDQALEEQLNQAMGFDASRFESLWHPLFPKAQVGVEDLENWQQGAMAQAQSQFPQMPTDTPQVPPELAASLEEDIVPLPQEEVSPPPVDHYAEMDRYLKLAYAEKGDAALQREYFAKAQEEQYAYLDYYHGLVERQTTQAGSAAAPSSGVVDMQAERLKAIEAEYGIAYTNRRLGNYHEAAQRFTSFLEQYPDSEFVPFALCQLGLTYYEDLQDYANALPVFQEVARRYPYQSRGKDAKRYIERAQRLLAQSRAEPSFPLAGIPDDEGL